MEKASNIEITRAKKFIYIDNSNEERKVVFECQANNIIEADEMYYRELGITPEKQTHIGCQVHRIENDNNSLLENNR